MVLECPPPSVSRPRHVFRYRNMCQNHQRLPGAKSSKVRIIRVSAIVHIRCLEIMTWPSRSLVPHSQSVSPSTSQSSGDTGGALILHYCGCVFQTFHASSVRHQKALHGSPPKITTITIGQCKDFLTFCSLLPAFVCCGFVYFTETMVVQDFTSLVNASHTSPAPPPIPQVLKPSPCIL